MRSVQGNPPTPLDLLQALGFESGHSLPAASRDIIATLASGNPDTTNALRRRLQQILERQSDRFEDKVNWFMRIVASKDPCQETDQAWLLHLRKHAMLPGMKLLLKQIWRTGRVFEMHTCSNSLDLPQVTMDYQEFKEDLDAIIIDRDYNIA